MKKYINILKNISYWTPIIGFFTVIFVMKFKDKYHPYAMNGLWLTYSSIIILYYLFK